MFLCKNKLLNVDGTKPWLDIPSSLKKCFSLQQTTDSAVKEQQLFRTANIHESREQIKQQQDSNWIKKIVYHRVSTVFPLQDEWPLMCFCQNTQTLLLGGGWESIVGQRRWLVMTSCLPWQDLKTMRQEIDWNHFSISTWKKYTSVCPHTNKFI